MSAAVAASSVQLCWVKRIDNSRLVRQRDPAYLRESLALLAASGVSLAIVLLCAWQHFDYVRTGYRLEETRARHEQVLEWNRTLRLERAALLDPMRIDLLARRQLGLEAPQAGQLITPAAAGTPGSVPVLARAPWPVAADPARAEKQVSLAD